MHLLVDAVDNPLELLVGFRWLSWAHYFTLFGAEKALSSDLCRRNNKKVALNWYIGPLFYVGAICRIIRLEYGQHTFTSYSYDSIRFSTECTRPTKCDSRIGGTQQTRRFQPIRIKMNLLYSATIYWPINSVMFVENDRKPLFPVVCSFTVCAAGVSIFYARTQYNYYNCVRARLRLNIWLLAQVFFISRKGLIREGKHQLCNRQTSCAHVRAPTSAENAKRIESGASASTQSIDVNPFGG